MADIKTRIALKYDTLARWNASTIVLKAGEAAIATVETATKDAKGNIIHVPTTLVKYGDGEKTFAQLPFASAIAADVYPWAKEQGLTINKDGTGNVVSGIEWDATANGGKGGVKFTTASVATAEGLAELQEEVYGEGGSKDNSRIDKIEKDIADNRAKWEEKTTDTDLDTRYSFAIVNGKLEIKSTLYTLGKAGTETTVATLDFVTPDELTETLKGYKTKQTAYSAEGSTTKTITKVEQNANGEVTVTYGDIAFPTRVADATHADGAAKVDKALTVKVGGTDVIFDGSAEKTADVDAAISAAVNAKHVPEYSIIKDATSEYAATYHLTKDGVNVGTAINIPKDMVVESGTVETLEEGVWGAEGTYIILTLSNATNDKLYINVGDLIEYVTSGSTANDAIVIDIDADHKVTATITDGKITKAKLETSVQTSLGKADTALQSVKVLGQTLNQSANEITVDQAKTALGWDSKLDANGWVSAENGDLTLGNNSNGKQASLGLTGISFSEYAENASVGKDGLYIFTDYNDKGESDWVDYQVDGIETDKGTLTFPEKGGTLVVDEDIKDLDLDNKFAAKLDANGWTSTDEQNGWEIGYAGSDKPHARLTNNGIEFYGNNADDATVVNDGVISLMQYKDGQGYAIEIDSTSIAGIDYNNIAQKNDITAAVEALDSSVAATAEADGKVSVLTGVTQTDGKLTAKTEVTLGKLAKKDAITPPDFADEVFVFDCGNATEVI